jgi:Cd2+/Zn2+-exporting ATPase
MSGCACNGCGTHGDTVLVVKGLDCPAEERLIRDRLGDIHGVAATRFDLDRGTLTLTHAPGALADVLDAIRSLGMVVEVKETPDLVPPPSVANRWPWALVVSGCCAVAAEVAHQALEPGHLAVVGLAVASILLGGSSTYRKGWAAIRSLDPSMNALMTIAVTGAALIGQWPEAAMVIFLFSVGERLESLALQRARRAVQALVVMAPDSASRREPDGSWRQVPCGEVRVGDVLRARPGERVALDGRVTVGESAVDASPITGESTPVDKRPGDDVQAGTVNQTGLLEYTVTAAAGDTVLARVTRLVAEAQASRAPAQRAVDRFARRYTPAVLVVGLLVATVGGWLGEGSAWEWTYRALVILVVACPCALVISTPVTIVSGLTAAARLGILVKGGAQLEKAARLQVVALDKTGTLTAGRPVQTDCVPVTGDDVRCRTLAASLAQGSNHPVSRAIAEGREMDGLLAVPVEGLLELPGRGVQGRFQGRTLHLANRRLVQELGLRSPNLDAALEGLEARGRTTVVLVEDGIPLCVLGVADTCRPWSRAGVEALTALGVRTVILSGDNVRAVQAVAREVGVTDARGGLLPHEKLRDLGALRAAHGAVGMVGDGINDAPALAHADLGIAMGAAGTDVAVEAADVVLVDDDLRKVATLVRLARATTSLLAHNIAVTLAIKLAFLALAVAGHATMWMAVFADTGATLLVIANGMRVLRFRELPPPPGPR